MSSNAERICLEGDRQPQEPQVTTIGKLPDIVFEEIFSYLSAQEVKSAALVCKNWDRVIGSAAVTMKKFKIVIDDAKFDEPFSSTRKHQNIELCRTIGHATDITLEGKIIISQAKTFESKCGEEGLDNSLGLMQTLELMPLLEELSVETPGFKRLRVKPPLEDLSVEIETPSFGKLCYKTVDLPKLKDITLKGVNAFILQFLTAKKLINVDLQSLTHVVPAPTDAPGVHHVTARNEVVSHTACPPTSAQSTSKAELVTDFVMKCKDIKALEIDTSDAEHFLKRNWIDCGLKFEIFSLHDTTLIADVPSFLANLKNFFMSQAETPTGLYFEDFEYTHQPQILLDGIWSNLKYLPKLDCLTFSQVVNDISELARFNPHLTDLHVFWIKNSLDDGLQMTSLECFEADEIFDADAWESIIRSSPKLETVIVHESESIYEDLDVIINVLMQHPNVKFLKFYMTCTRDVRQIFDLISSNYNYGHLESLELHNFLTEGESIEFKFPADPSEWNESEQKARFEEIFPLDPVDSGDSDESYVFYCSKFQSSSKYNL